MTVKSLTHSSLEDNRFYRSMLAGNTAFSPSAYDLLETQVLSSSAASVTFTGLGSYTDYKHLQLRTVVRITHTANANTGDLQMRFNSVDTGYSDHRLNGDGSSVTSVAQVDTAEIDIKDLGPNAQNASENFGAAIIDILDFSNTAKNTTVRYFSGAYADVETDVVMGSGLWNNTAAVTSIEMVPNNPSWAAGSRFSLYGIR